MRIPDFNPRVNTIYCDMDGVLADFDAFVLEKMGRTFSHNSGPGSDKEMWEFLHGVPHLYLQLKPMPYAQRLWDAIIACKSKRAILTAIPRRTTIPTAEQDKRDWIPLHLQDDEEIIVKIGPYSRDKWKHAQPGDILIDDRPDNIREWIANGFGIGIYHDGNIEDTIRTLFDYTIGK